VTSDDINLLLDGVSDDSGEWMDHPGQACIKLARRLRGPAVDAVAELLRRTTDNHVALNCVRLLAAVRIPEADDALAGALDLPLADEVLEQVFEDAADSARLRHHPGFVANARALWSRWPHQELREFLSRVGAL
jgi:hypothetical protein